MNNQKNNIDAQKKISDTTNQILLKNSELLKQNSVYVAKESERSVVDVETLRTTTARLIETLKEVQAIHEEATKNRKATEEEITAAIQELADNYKLDVETVRKFIPTDSLVKDITAKKALDLIYNTGVAEEPEEKAESEAAEEAESTEAE